MGPIPGVYAAWGQWRNCGGLPYSGGWMEQPLSLLVQMMALETAQRAIETVERGGEEKKPTKGLAALNGSQLALYTWLQAD